MTPLPPPDFIVLASTSPRRRQFIEALDVPFAALAPAAGPNRAGIDETPQPGESPQALVQRLSRAKMEAVANNLPMLLPTVAQFDRLIVIGSDTEVALGQKIFGKPVSPAHATTMLQQLRARIHHVFSGLSVGYLSGRNPNQVTTVTRLSHSKVHMRPYTRTEIEAYVATGAPLDKAGAYGIQDLPFAPVQRLDGCFAAVMGFPVRELACALAEMGLHLPGLARTCGQFTGQPCCLA